MWFDVEMTLSIDSKASTGGFVSPIQMYLPCKNIEYFA